MFLGYRETAQTDVFQYENYPNQQIGSTLANRGQEKTRLRCPASSRHRHVCPQNMAGIPPAIAAGLPDSLCGGEGKPASSHTSEEKMTTKAEELKGSTALSTETVDNPRDNGGPLGQKMALNLSPRRLLGDDNDAIKNRVAYHPEMMELAGKIWGIVTHGVSHPNGKDPTKLSIRWAGEIGFEDRAGHLGETSSCYLPNTVERDLKNQGVPIIAEGSGQKPEFFEAAFSVEFWLKGCERRDFETGYTYECWNRMGRRRNINRLAPPEVRAKLPAEAESARQLLGYEIDNDTGEVTEVEAEAEAAE